jgi:dethiobiotin synthetase
MTDAGSATDSTPYLVLVAGTGTEIGKTWLTAQLAKALRAQAVTVSARKPAQSFDRGDRVTDAHLLGDATGETAADVCPHHRWYEIPMAPPMAADALGRPSFTIADLGAEIGWGFPTPQVGLVESAGGVRSPLAHDGDTVTLAEELQPALVVLVADAGLGTINGVRLSMEALDKGAHVASIVVFLNRFDGADELHRRNRGWLADRDRFEVMTAVPELSGRVRTALMGSLGA